MFSGSLRKGLVILALVLSAGACDSGDEPGQALPDAAPDGSQGEAGTCPSAIERQHATDDPPPTHVASIEGVQYPSNPPASGPHCSTWGRYTTYPADAPLPRCHWIHNIEHGAVVVLYNCPAGCPGLVTELEQIIAATPPDPDCSKPRVILTPDPLIETQVAASAWGRTWTATCLDDGTAASLKTFVAQHLGTRGIAPEPAVCSDGQVGPE